MVIPVIEATTAKQNPAATRLARLDDEELRIAVEAATADVAVATLNRDANLVSIKRRLPAMIESAQAEASLADLDLVRVSKLFQQNAISRSEADAARTRVSTTRASLATAKADLAQAEAQQLALEAQVSQANQRLSEAKRNLRNAVLHSPFPGRVTEVHAVPGTYVKEGDPIVTVQMMDPMSIEFEVTARDSRRYHRGDMLTTRVIDGKGSVRSLIGMVNQVDSVADPATRTFTVSLHVRNEIDETCSVPSSSGEPIARTDMIAPLNIGPIITGDERLLVERDSVHRLDGEDVVWKITNRKWGTPSPAKDRVLTVEKVPVKITSEVIPFLGKWQFVAIELKDPTTPFDIDRDLITGKLFFKPNSTTSITPDESPENQAPQLESWKGNQVMVDERRWLLRSGDVAQVQLTPNAPNDGFYVPMKAIREERGQRFIHVVEKKNDQLVARRIIVDHEKSDTVVDESVLLLLEAFPPHELHEGMQVVSEGTHYLEDGDTVQITSILRGNE
ncbi:efflux RND transporter periplasmic adaptor subunit [Rhodopirellula sallentina]|nr:efflux RND transporter periplasmic adaptor subunit [Rhodopirellula sallentina]